MNGLILALDNLGQPSHWMTWQEAIVQEVLGKVSYGFGNFEFTFRGGVNRVTGRESEVSLKSILVLAGHNPKHVWNTSTVALTNTALFQRDQYMCAYCGKTGSRGLTRDHIVPLSRGGRDDWLNCCACCQNCNARKSSHTLEELGWELLYVPYKPNHQEGLILQNRRILADQMEFLRASLPKHSRI